MEGEIQEIYQYYKRLYPWGWLEKFITRGGKYEFGQFVFFFFVKGFGCAPGGFPVRERMQFPTLEALKEFVFKNRVVEMLMSAWYPLEMSMGKTSTEASAVPTKDKWFHNTMLERPLILDYDLTDMDFIRKAICKCQGKTCCDDCWEVLIEKTALPYLRLMLEEFCQFKEVLYVFSGRRGIHVHVTDDRVLGWSLQQRKLFMSNLMENKDACPPVFTEVFDQYVAPQHHSDVPELTKHMNTVFPEGFGGEQTIGAMLEYAKGHHARAYARVEDVIQFALKPRFDPGFTKDITHLIKIPYTIHRDTGKLCVPLKPELRPSTAMKYTEAFLIDNPFNL